VKHLSDMGTKHWCRHYKSTAKGDEGRTMYVIFVPNPYNGNVVIIHSSRVVVEKEMSKFSELEATACTFAVSLPYTVARLEAWWTDVIVHNADEAALPRPMPVMDSHPTWDMDEVETYFDESLRIHRFGATTELSSKPDDDGNECKVFSIHLSTQFETEYEARFVYTPSARNFDEVGRYHKYVDETVRATAGFNTGYSRWMDEHWAFSLSSGAGHTLDQLRFSLEDALSPYHAHVTEKYDDATLGSLWAWGVSGMAIEWHGLIDYTTLHDPIGAFDFCTSDTECIKADETCKEQAVDDDGDDDLAGATSIDPWATEIKGDRKNIDAAKTNGRKL